MEKTTSIDSINERQYILDSLVEFAYEYKEQQFQLSSGKHSNEYIDCRNMLSRASLLPTIGSLFTEELKLNIQAVGGLTMGADSISIATALITSYRHKNFKWFTIRKEIKKHGKQKLIEGAVVDGDCVAIMDDVITTGESIIEAIKKSQEFGLKVVQVLALVDREEGGIENIQNKYNIPITALFKKSKIRIAFENKNR